MTTLCRNFKALLRQMLAHQLLWLAYWIAPAETKGFLLRAMADYGRLSAAWFHHLSEQNR